MCDQNRTTAEGETNSMKKAPSELREKGIEGESSFYQPSRLNSGPCAQSGARAADSIAERTPRRFVDMRSVTSRVAVRTTSASACCVAGSAIEPARSTRRLSSEIRSACSRDNPTGPCRACRASCDLSPQPNRRGAVDGALARGGTLRSLPFPRFFALVFIAFSLPFKTASGAQRPETESSWTPKAAKKDLAPQGQDQAPA